MYNKKLYKEILDHFNKDLDLVNYEIKSLLSKNNTELNEDMSSFLFSKSKRLRPLILFLTKDALNAPDNDNIVKLAAALELLHSATLLHDDIIDDAKLRRLKPTINHRYNSKMAVLSGDYLLSLSLKLLCDIGLPEIFCYFSENTLNICRGEINQFFNREKLVTIEEYLEKSKNKTSSLFMARAKSLIYLINEKMQKIPDNIQKAFLDYILSFSLAFQIYDDIENFQNENTEKISSDAENGIYTLPYLYISQQNHSCDIINFKNEKLNKELYNDALNFSKEYLNKTLDKAKNSLKITRNIYKTELLIKLTEVFKG